MNTMKKLASLSMVALLSISLFGCASTTKLTQEQANTVYQYNYQKVRANGQSEKSAKTMANIATKTFKMNVWAENPSAEELSKIVKQMKKALK